MEAILLTKSLYYIVYNRNSSIISRKLLTLVKYRTNNRNQKELMELISVVVIKRQEKKENERKRPKIS